MEMIKLQHCRVDNSSQLHHRGFESAAAAAKLRDFVSSPSKLEQAHDRKALYLIQISAYPSYCLVSIFLADDLPTVHEPDAAVQVCREREPGAVRSHGVGGLAICCLMQNKLQDGGT